MPARECRAVSVCGLDAQTLANDRFRHERTFKMPDGNDRLWSIADGSERQIVGQICRSQLSHRMAGFAKNGRQFVRLRMTMARDTPERQVLLPNLQKAADG